MFVMKTNIMFKSFQIFPNSKNTEKTMILNLKLLSIEDY
jgi:hypothetical protein